MIFVDDILQYFRDLGHAAEYGSLTQLNEQLTSVDYSQSTDGMVAFVRLLGEQRTVDGYDQCDIAVHLSWLCLLDFDGETLLSTQEQAKDTLKGWLQHLRDGNTVKVSTDARWQFGYDDFAENVAWVVVRVTLTSAAADCVPLVIPTPPTPAINPSWLYFTMPNGGTITLRRNGDATNVSFEISTDNGNTWSEWTQSGRERTFVLAEGETVHIRNTSETSTRLSIGSGGYFNFSFSEECEAGGNVNSLLCKNAEDAELSDYCFYSLFKNCRTLTTPPLFPATVLAPSCYNSTFWNCTGLLSSPLLTAENLVPYCYSGMFLDCSSVDKITTMMVDVSASGCLYNWLNGAAEEGDFYCNSELVIPEGTSGIPSGWTRHDL